MLSGFDDVSTFSLIGIEDRLRERIGETKCDGIGGAR